MTNLILALWRRYQRSIDVKLLWPPLVAEAIDRAHARASFRVHMTIDPAYSDMDEAEKRAFLDGLP